VTRCPCLCTWFFLPCLHAQKALRVREYGADHFLSVQSLLMTRRPVRVFLPAVPVRSERVARRRGKVAVARLLPVLPVVLLL